MNITDTSTPESDLAFLKSFQDNSTRSQSNPEYVNALNSITAKYGDYREFARAIGVPENNEAPQYTPSNEGPKARIPGEIYTSQKTQSAATVDIEQMQKLPSMFNT